MTEKSNSPLQKELKAPYPGLRPFLDHEHNLLMGRDEQIQQVIDRLRETHFVAIIGGSGSGKSSLIRAGVVPQLRAYAIPAAGDYWVPVVFTPGTTKADPQPEQGVVPDVQTPVTRFAWKFAQVMQPSQDGKVNLALRDEVAAYLRQEAGISRLVEAYYRLLPRLGPSAEKARFLFVIDQFEELFHPNNRDDPDTRLIVEAVIDHFRSPDPRAYLVMTMRSEHLADCAAYLDLPDAINRSFYLVRRLSNGELREVITQPAQVMQRLVQRQNPERSAPVLFQPEVVARLLADARRIEDDPDHLPLLQHLLARIWSVALARERRQPTGDVPAAVTMDDLEAAVAPWPKDRAAGWLAGDRKLNALSSSLENWAEQIYLHERSETEQAHINDLLTKLAYKDPNNGLYFQQRVKLVDKPGSLQGNEAPRQATLDLLKDGFVDGVNYLFWDDENRDHVTLKVSHEAFIRGWPRFRRVADEEAERFEEFVAVLRRCGAWQDGEAENKLLLEASEIERIGRKGLLPVFEDPRQRKDWFAVLKLYREGERLVKLEDICHSFIKRSIARQQRLKDEAEAQAQEFKAAEEVTRKLEEETRIARARYQAGMEAAKARELQIQAEAALQRAKAEAERNQARANEEAANAEAARAVADAASARAESERNEALAASAQADVEKNEALVASALADAERNKALVDKQAAEARVRTTKFLAVLGVFLLVFVPIAAYSWLFYGPAIASINQFVESQRDINSRQPSELSRIEYAGVTELETLTEAAAKTVAAGAGKPFFPGMWTAEVLREKTLGLPLLNAGSLQRLVDAVSTEALVNREIRGLLVTAVWDGLNTGDPPSTRSEWEDEQKCRVTRWESVPEKEVTGRYIPSQKAGLGLFVPNVDASTDEMVIFSAQRKAPDQPCTGRYAFSVPAGIQPTFMFGADLSTMALVAPGQDTTLYNIEWNWDGRASAGTMMAKLAFRRVLTDPRSTEAFQGVASTQNPPTPVTPANPARVLETRALTGGVEVKLGSKWWQLFSTEARPLPDIESISEERWQRLTTPDKGSTCDVLNGWLNAPPEKKSEGPADPERPTPSIKVEVMAVAGDRHCVSIKRIDSSGGTGVGKAALSEVVFVDAYQAVAIEAERAYAGGRERAPEKFAAWRFDIQVPDTQRDWWVGKPGTHWDGWLAATSKGSTKNAVASPYSTEALLRLAKNIVEAAPVGKPDKQSAKGSGIATAGKP